MKPLIATVIFTVLLVPFGGSAQADTTSRTFALHDIIGLAIERNPMIAGAMAAIDQSTGQRTAAGAYPNPTIHGDSGKGYLRDGGPLTTEIPTSATEYMAGFSQPLEWPAKRAARQRAATRTNPSLGGPEYTGWRRQWALSVRRRQGIAGWRKPPTRRWPEL